MNIELMKNRRKELGMTQQELAEKCALSRVSISNYEMGKSEPTKENIEILARVLGVSENDLLLENNSTLDFSKEEYNKTINSLSVAFSEKITDFLEKKYKNKNLSFKIAVCIGSLLNDLTSKNYIFSYTLKKVIAFDYSSNYYKTFDFSDIEQYILNILSLTENLEKTSHSNIKRDSFDKLLIEDSRISTIGTFKDLLIGSDTSRIFIVTANCLLAAIGSDSEIDIEKRKKLENLYLYTKKVLDLSEDFDTTSKINLMEDLDTYYNELEKKYFNQMLNKEGGSDE